MVEDTRARVMKKGDRKIGLTLPDEPRMPNNRGPPGAMSASDKYGCKT